jgi:flagellum-specific peptidoglycan hydrolase FlgJ
MCPTSVQIRTNSGKRVDTRVYPYFLSLWNFSHFLPSKCIRQTVESCQKPKEGEVSLMHRIVLFRGFRVCSVIFCALFIFLGIQFPAAAEDVSLVIDGQKIDVSPSPIIKDGRTLVPTRVVSETLGAVVDWYEQERAVTVEKDSRSVKLRIDNRLVDFEEDGTTYDLIDVPPQIIDDRTFVPLRLVSNALGVSVRWNESDRTVYIDSSEHSGYMPFYNMTLPTVRPGQIITGTTQLKAGFNGSQTGAAEIKFQLLNPNTGVGPVIARGNDINGTYTWLPDPFYNGPRVLAAAIYDKAGCLLQGKVVPVELAVAPTVGLSGVTKGQSVKGAVSLKADINFTAEYVKYEITNMDTGNVVVTDPVDPYGSYSWAPGFKDNGETSIRAIAYDRFEKAYSSPTVTVRVEVERKLELRGVSAGASVEKPVTLSLSRNFPITRVEYLLKDPQSGKEHLLSEASGYASYKWFPGPGEAGTWTVVARVTDDTGNTFTSNSITVKVPGTPKLLLETVGPNQVLTDTVKLKSSSNVPLAKIEYLLIDPKTGKKRVIGGGNDPTFEYSWIPQKKDAGSWKIQASATAVSGKNLTSDAVPITIYLGKIYGSKPIIEKSRFLDFASKLAKQSQATTGMSAALQTAQAILETGWGQYTPVDKYTGQLSNNLFGIKGKGPAGSVTSNTWEEYNGNTFRVDAAFRAYNDPAESWADHKRLLLTSDRYAPFRAVMHDGFKGAWALKRAGYATDSQYPTKLINIMKQYNLHLLDEMGI